MLQPSVPLIQVGLKAFDGNGNLTSEYPMQKANSWIRNGYNLAVACAIDGKQAVTAFSDGYINRKTTEGTIRTHNDYSAETSMVFTDYAAGAGDDTYGIQIGTGTNAVTIDDFKLQTKISTGSTTGKMDYQAMQLSDAWVGGIITVTQKRYFNNNSGATITVNEVGFVGTEAGTIYGAGKHMTIRDIISPGISIVDTGQLLVTYTFTLDCSP
jgi:hypothetical protein